MKIEKTKLEGVLLITPELFPDGGKEIFADHRGIFIEIYNEFKYKSSDIDVHFVEDDISISTKNVLRGIHGNSETWKLISCLQGKLFFVVVNCDKKSDKFGTWESFNLNDSNHSRILVPPKHGNGYVALTDTVMIHYKQSSYYNPTEQFTYRWNDPKFGIPWPVKDPILTPRDASAKYIEKKKIWKLGN